MVAALKRHLSDVVTAAIPGVLRVREYQRGGDLSIDVDRATDIPYTTHIISICIFEDAVKHYERSDEKQKQQARERLEKYLVSQFEEFFKDDPLATKTFGPVCEWHIFDETLNG